MADIFIQRRWLGKRGPYTEEELRTWVRDGKVSPHTPAWRQGMSEWKPIGAWPFMSASTGLQGAVRPGRRRTYDRVQRESPGIGRLQYVFMSVVLNACMFLLVLATSKYGTNLEEMMTGQTGDGSDNTIPVFIAAVQALFAIGGALWLGIRRLQNIGWHWAWILLLFVPMANIVLAGCLLILPPDYAATEKLDLAGCGLVLLLLLLIAAVIAGLSASPEITAKLKETMQERFPFTKRE